MIKTILYNLKKRISLFLTNRYIDEYLSKLYIAEIHKRLRDTNKNLYALDGYKVYSQNDEDGIINSIFNDIGVTNKLFCEIGIGDTVENNTHNLLLNDWTGLWIDINGKHIKKLKKKISKNQNKLDFIINKITPTNINHFIVSSEKMRKNNEIDFFSIDIDSYDLQCLQNLDVISPRLICVEYNSKIRENIKLKINEIKNFKWEYDDYFGSSLLSINSIMDKKGYKLVATNITGSNAFYVKKELSVLTKTNNQNIKDLYSPPNFELFNFNVTHAPTNKYLINKLNE
tara:strand:- start:321 stop:1178 length:858 start_codon:yes stop_codon:yes gene_type:complete